MDAAGFEGISTPLQEFILRIPSLQINWSHLDSSENMSNIDGSGAGGGGGSENRGVENSSPDAVGVSSPNNADAGSGSIPVSPLEHSSESKETGIEEPPIKQPDGETDPTSLQKDENDSRSNSLMGKLKITLSPIRSIFRRCVR